VILCLCHGLGEEALREAARAARSVREMRLRLGLPERGCRLCEREMAALLREVRERQREEA
jgi:bacterioferritin-associated ferredoxin